MRLARLFALTLVLGVLSAQAVAHTQIEGMLTDAAVNHDLAKIRHDRKMLDRELRAEDRDPQLKRQ
jgi:hypothetical protein